MRGQLIFQFVLASFVFFALIFWVIGFLSGSYSDYSQRADLELKRAVLFSFSEILLKHVLSNPWPKLDSSKIDWFCYCEDCKSVAERFGLVYHSLAEQRVFKYRVEINGTVGGQRRWWKCGYPLPSRYLAIERYGLLEGRPVKVFIAVW